MAQQTIGDVGDCSGGQPGGQCEIGPRHRTPDADRVQGHSLIVISGAFEVGAG
jgi:hypothetical protein